MVLQRVLGARPFLPAQTRVEGHHEKNKMKQVFDQLAVLSRHSSLQVNLKDYELNIACLI